MIETNIKGLWLKLSPSGDIFHFEVTTSVCRCDECERHRKRFFKRIEDRILAQALNLKASEVVK